MRYQTKPTIIEAWQVRKDNWKTLEQLDPNKIAFIGNNKDGILECLGLSVETNLGQEFIGLGDWLCKYKEGGFYSCKHLDFIKIYEIPST